MYKVILRVTRCICLKVTLTRNCGRRTKRSEIWEMGALATHIMSVYSSMSFWDHSVHLPENSLYNLKTVARKAKHTTLEHEKTSTRYYDMQGTWSFWPSNVKKMYIYIVDLCLICKQQQNFTDGCRALAPWHLICCHMQSSITKNL